MSHPAARTSEVPPFDVADAVTPVGTAPCAECRNAIVDTYYEADEGVVCAPCQARLASNVEPDVTRDRLSRAAKFGAAAAAGSASVYFGLLAAIGHEVSVALIAIGFVIGRAVRSGARGRGGRAFQWLAIGLTYLTMVATYVPFVLKGSDASDFGALLLLAIAAPILEGIDHGLTLIMIALALGQAWRTNRRVEPKLAGPFRVRAGAGLVRMGSES
ncbi:MAG TPA: hypothetical protein VFW03_10135 [Gemmatimonadaceae bacterium]|nr:hypothetical protein [Gemmatimonadaceae bacterium]